MAGVTIGYKGNTIATIQGSGSKILKTAGKYCEGDISVDYVQEGGSGIGLSIVKKIIEDHGGYIWATSKEGESTCMHFVLRKYIEL